MYDTIASQFTDALQREGKSINSYSDNSAYTVLFRKNSDKNSMNNKLTIYYRVTENISQGQLLKYKDRIYIVENQETSENEVYYKSDLLQTNASINNFANGIESNIPVFSYDMVNVLPQTSQTIPVINGNLEMVTTDNAISRALAVNNTFNSMGGTWKIDNLIYKCGIAHIYVERTTGASNTYTVEITANDSYGTNTTSKLIATAKINTDVVTNATIQWTSSDTSKATIDNSGNVNFLAIGSVTFIALWVEHNITTTKTVSVNAYGVSITANDSYLTTDTPTLTATAKINDTVDTTATFTWASSDTTKAIIDSTGVVTFLAAGTVTFSALWTQQNATGTKQITITQPVSKTCTITSSASGGAFTITAGYSTTFTGQFWQGATELTDQTAEWNNDIPSTYTADFTITNSDNTITIKCKSGSGMLKKSFNLTLQDSQHTCTITQAILVRSLF